MSQTNVAGPAIPRCPAHTSEPRPKRRCSEMPEITAIVHFYTVRVEKL